MNQNDNPFVSKNLGIRWNNVHPDIPFAQIEEFAKTDLARRYTEALCDESSGDEDKATEHFAKVSSEVNDALEKKYGSCALHLYLRMTGKA